MQGRRKEYEAMSGDKLSSDLIHAVRGRMAALQPFLDVLLQGSAGPLSGEQRVCLDAIDRNLRRLFTDVTETLELLRQDLAQLRVRPEELSCAALLQGAAQLLRSRGLPDPILLEPEADLRVRADGRRTAAVLATLAARAAADSEAPVVLAPRRGQGSGMTYISICSPDCGDGGCPPPEGPDPVDASLLLCRALVEEQGGRLWIGSDVRAGAFCLALPEGDRL